MQEIPSERVCMDLLRWPIAVLTVRGQLTDADYALIFDACEALIVRTEDFVFVTDARGVTSLPTPAQRRFIGERMRSVHQRVGARSRGSVIVVESALLRSVMAVITWVSPQRRPLVFTRTLTEAWEHADRFLKQERRQTVSSTR
jgi:hypothetical protein